MSPDKRPQTQTSHRYLIKKQLTIVRPCKWQDVQQNFYYQRSFARHQGWHKKLAWLSVAVQSNIGKVICLGKNECFDSSSGQPIFYMRTGKIMRLADKIVKAYKFVTQNEAWK